MRHDLSRRHGHAIRKSPQVIPHPEGVSAHAPPGTRPARRANEQGGVSIAELLSTGLQPTGYSCPKPWAIGPTPTEYSVLPAPLVKRGSPLVCERSGDDQDDCDPCAGRPGAECLLCERAGDLRR